MSKLEILTNTEFIGAILSVIIFITIGYILVKKHVIDESGKKAITFIVLNIGLPCLVFKSFMSDFSSIQLKTNIVVLILSFIGYIVLLLLGNLLFIKKENKKILAIIMTLSQVSLFSMPIINAIYHTNEALIPINIVAINFRIFLYGYSYIIFSKDSEEKKSIKLQLKTMFLNPIVIAMILGLIIWSTQNLIFNININDEKVSIFRIDKVIPSFYMVINFASNLITPLSMMLIGISIGKYEIKDALKNKMSWILAIGRSIIGPVVMFILIVITKEVFKVNLSEYQMAGLMFAFAAPVSAVVNTYAIKFQKEEFNASSACFFSTFISVIMFPIIYVIIYLYA